MAQERSPDEAPQRREDEALGGPAIGGDGVAPGLAGELGVPPHVAGGEDPTMAGAKPTMMGVYETPTLMGRLGGLGPLILVLLVIGVLMLLGYALFAAHEAGAQHAAVSGGAARLAHLLG
jgi:hypothetical protein